MNKKKLIHITISIFISALFSVFLANIILFFWQRSLNFKVSYFIIVVLFISPVIYMIINKIPIWFPKVKSTILTNRIYFVLICFIIPFWFFFIMPVFLNSGQSMEFINYISRSNPIGADFKFDLNFSRSLILNHEPTVNIYPPLSVVLFTPFAYLTPQTAYFFIILIDIICIILISFILPKLINPKLNSEIAMLFFVSSFLAYGTHFEIERGQWNLIAVTLSIIAIYLFYNQPKLRIISFILFSISIQLKLYPAIYIFLFWDQFDYWKNNIIRVVGLGLFNILLLFCLGFDVFYTFYQNLSNVAANPYLFSLNHSTDSFVYYLKNDLNVTFFEPIQLKIILLSTAFIFLFGIFITSYSGFKKINPILLLGCTIMAMILPSVSVDYKLIILTAPVQYLLIQFPEWENKYSKQLWSNIFLFIITIAYATTLYSSLNKPAIFGNNFLVLYIILFTATMLSVFLGINKKSLSKIP